LAGKNLLTDIIMEKEAKSRIRINRLLSRAGWRFFDDENGPANITLETNIKIKKKDISAFKRPA